MKEFYTYEEVVMLIEIATNGSEEDAREFLDRDFIAKALPTCEILNCKETAEWEGWIGEGLIRRVNVCNSHKHLLRGYKEDEV